MGPDQGNYQERSFVFMNMRHLRDNREKMERYLRGEAPAPEDSPWNKSNVNFQAKEVIRRGEFQVGGQEGPLPRRAAARSNHKGERENGLVTIVLPECPDDRLRFGVWIGPAPTAPRASRRPRWITGNAGRSRRVQEFLGHFRLCGGRGRDRLA